MIPVYAFVEGDTIGTLLLAYPHDTAETLCKKLLQASRTRVWPNEDFVLHYAGRSIEKEETVQSLGLTALDRVDMRLKG